MSVSSLIFVSGLVGALPPLHQLTRNVGIELPEFLGKLVNDPAEAAKLLETAKTAQPVEEASVEAPTEEAPAEG